MAQLIFDPRGRLHDVRRYRLVTAPALKIACFLVAMGAAVSWFFWQTVFSLHTSPVAGVALVMTGLASGLLLIVTFGVTFFPYKKPSKTVQDIADALETADTLNCADAASFECIQTLGETAIKRKESKALEHSIYAAWLHPNSQKILHRLELDGNQALQWVTTHVLPQLSWQDLIAQMVMIATQTGDTSFEVTHVVGAVLLHPALQNTLRSINLRHADILFVIWWINTQARLREARRRWWDEENLLHFSGVGLSWAAGYTPLLDRFDRIPRGDLWNEIPLGREQQIQALMYALAREHHGNVLLVGQPGVGRLGIIREFERRVRYFRAHPVLNGLRVIYIHVGELLGLSTNTAGQFAAVSNILNDIDRGGNMIAVLDGLGSILGETGESRVNMTDVLLPIFSSTNVRVIVMVSNDEYHLRLSHNTELMNLFDIVSVDSLSEEDTLKLLALVTPRIERKNHLFLPYRTLVSLVEETASILPQIPFPKKAFELLEEAMVTVKATKQSTVTKDHIEHLISQKVGINIGKVSKAEREELLNLEELMHKRVVNQHLAIQVLSRAMVRARANVRSKTRPIGTFLFLGPTGVGKTETAKTLAEAFFGSEQTLRRLDMAEFKGPDAIENLIGSRTQANGRLTDMISDHPYCVVLLDEFEKASREVHNLFLQVFDEGYIIDTRGQRVSFLHTVIVATSNAGAEFIRTQGIHEHNPQAFEKQLREYVLEQGIFSPELLNRFDAVITFTPLKEDHIREVATRMLRSLNKRLDAQHGVTVALTEELITYLVSIGYDPEFGARPMARAIQNTVEYAVARKIISGHLEPGQELVITPTELKALQSAD